MTLRLPVQTPTGVTIAGPLRPEWAELLSKPALAFVAELARRFEPERQRLLSRRRFVQERLDAGRLPDFLPETQGVRASDWRVAPTPKDLDDRRVEITGPVDRKMVINALNSGANVFMADFEDSTAPTWANVVEGQRNLFDAVRRTITYDHPATGKHYALAPDTATLVVRPRGWHLPERHLLIDGEPISASLFDFGLYFFHNARELLARGTGPYFYLPKLESHLEARLWNAVFLHAQEALGIPSGTIRATVLIETVLAAFEMDEILFELREHSSGAELRALGLHLLDHQEVPRAPRSGAPRPRAGRDDRALHAQLQPAPDPHVPPPRRPPRWAAWRPRFRSRATTRPMRRRSPRSRRTSAARPATGTTARGSPTPLSSPWRAPCSTRAMPGANQIGRLREDVEVRREDLLAAPEGPITEAGLRQNVAVGLRYLAAWLAGTGCVPLYHLMEDAATAEISRAQLWQWLHQGARLEDGRHIDAALVTGCIDEELEAIRAEVGDPTWTQGHHGRAGELFRQMVTAEAFEEFLTLPAYEQILTIADQDR